MLEKLLAVRKSIVHVLPIQQKWAFIMQIYLKYSSVSMIKLQIEFVMYIVNYSSSMII